MGEQAEERGRSGGGLSWPCRSSPTREGGEGWRKGGFDTVWRGAGAAAGPAGSAAADRSWGSARPPPAPRMIFPFPGAKLLGKEQEGLG